MSIKTASARSCIVRNRVCGPTVLVHFRARERTRLSWKYLFPFMLTLVVPSALPAAAASHTIASEQDNSSNYTLRVNANLVVMNATVVNRHNVLVSGLVQDDFQIYENHILQPIRHFSHEDLPVTVGLVIDNSGSMRPKRDDVIAASMSFANSSNPQDQIFVVNFNEHVTYGLPEILPFTDQRMQLQRALSTINTTGETALYDAIAVALDHLKQGKCDKKVLIIISDGGDNASKHSLAQISGMAKASDAIIYTIGVFDAQDGDQNPEVLKRFAKDTGGEAFFPQSSKEVATICEGIARDIRNQYTLAYVPTISKSDGGFRTVEVKVTSTGHGHLSVRTRTGYSVPPEVLPLEPGSVGHDTRQ